MKVGAVVLAAGAGARLGGVAKALLRRGDATFLESITRTARSAGAIDVVVVVAAPFDVETAAHARALDLRVVTNHRPERGMASSVALGFEAIARGDAEAAWLWPVDHPDVTPATLAALQRALALADAAHVVAKPRFAGTNGHPPLVARAAWDALAGCAHLLGGARSALAALPTAIVDVDDRGVLDDVDDHEDGA